MKKTRRTSKIPFTLTARRNALSRVRGLMEQGLSKGKAVLMIARELECHTGTIYNWLNQSQGTVVTNGNIQPVVKTNNNIVEPHITSVDLHVPGKGNITLNHELLTKISRLAGFTN